MGYGDVANSKDAARRSHKPERTGEAQRPAWLDAGFKNRASGKDKPRTLVRQRYENSGVLSLRLAFAKGWLRGSLRGDNPSLAIGLAADHTGWPQSKKNALHFYLTMATLSGVIS